MDVELFNRSVEAMGMIKAREKISAFGVICFPNNKDSTREKVMRELDQIAYPLKWAKTVTSEEALQILQAKGFGGRRNKNPASNRQGTTSKRR